MSTDKIAYTINEASVAIGIGRSKLYDLIATQKIIPRKIGSRTVILAEDLQNYVSNLPAPTSRRT